MSAGFTRAHVALQAERKVKLPGAWRVGGEVSVVVGERDADLNHPQHVDIHLQALVPADTTNQDPRTARLENGSRRVVLVIAIVSERSSWLRDNPRELRIHRHVGKRTSNLAYAGKLIAHVVGPPSRAKSQTQKKLRYACDCLHVANSTFFSIHVY